MKNFSFIKKQEEIENFYRILNESVESQEGLILAWQTDLQILKKLIPPPLEPSGPWVMAFVCYLPKCDFWKDYAEGALFIPVKYENESFAYFLSMPVACKSDMPIFLGREYKGFPKTNADEIQVHRSGDYIKVLIRRNEVDFFRAQAKIGDFNHPDANVLLGDYETGKTTTGNSINFKYDFNDNGNEVGFTRVRLVSSESTNICHSGEKCKISKIQLTPSIDDPWSELKVLQPLGAVYYKADCIMGKAKTLQRLDPEKYAPYLFSGWDSSVLGYVYRNFTM